MLIRDGFVTNSSSTSFLIISKDKLTHAYLQKKLGFSQKSIIDQDVNSFIDEIIYATTRGMEYFDISEINYEFVLKEFGKESADRKRLSCLYWLYKFRWRVFHLIHDNRLLCN